MKYMTIRGYPQLEVSKYRQHKNFKVQVSSKKPDQVGFVPIHKRWVVERTFAWLKRQRRLARDYEFDSENQRSMIFIGITKLILKRL